MDINIKTKYNIGDTVYIPEFYEEFLPSKPFKVTGVLINISTDITSIQYQLQSSVYEETVAEPQVFSTYEECTKWCDNRNNNS